MTIKLQAGHFKVGRWIYAPLSDVLVPKSGRICYGSKWWAVTENNEILFFDRYTSPQCNDNKAIIEHMVSSLNEFNVTPKFLDMVFLPHSCGDY